MTDEEENTWRALQGKDILVSRKCWWGWHQWTKWNEIGRDSRREKCSGFMGGGYNDYTAITLERKCIGCRMPQIKLVRYKVRY